MKKILTTDITSGVGMPIKSGTIDHLQNAYAEALSALAIKSIGSYDASKVYVLYGCENSGSGSNYDISAGAVFYNGEVYLVPAASFSASQTAVANLDISYFSGTNADPVEFTDAVSRNVHAIRQIVISDAESGSGLADYDDANSFIPSIRLIDDLGLVNINNGTGSVSALTIRYSINNNIVTIYFAIAGSISTYSGSGFFGMFIDLPITAKVTGLLDAISGIGQATLGSGSANTFCTVSIANFLTATPDKVSIGVHSTTTGAFSFYGQFTYPI